MRPFIAAFPKLFLVLATLVLLGAGLALRPATSSAAYERRDAFAGRIERGEQTLSTATIAKEWRTEIAAQRVIAGRDAVLAWGLLAVGVLGLIASVASFRAPTAANPGSAMTESGSSAPQGSR
jgi:hypothetical protein